MQHSPAWSYPLLLLPLLSIVARPSFAQHLLDQKISVSVYQKSLQETLSAISHQGHFNFSYNSNLLPQDSVVNLKTEQKTVKETLQKLLGNNFEFKEAGNYIIIRKYIPDGKPFVISGVVIDKSTGQAIANASVYESRQFVSTLTDDQGRFQLRLHNRYPDLIVRISKISFNDTLYQLSSAGQKDLTLAISPIRIITLNPVTVTPYSAMEANWLGKFLISSRQKIRDINLSNFFVRQPFQYSIWPGLGTHGKLSAQAVNKFSMNIFGGYSGGVNGFELGGLFNIDKKDVQHVQIGGLFNIVGGHMRGVQVGGLYNSVLDSVSGFQVSGIVNLNKQHVNGFQTAGIFNTSKSLSGVQIAGIGNRSDGIVDGVQISGIVNYAQHLKGLQVGLINISDTASNGYSIGLLNIVKKHGYYRLAVSWNEALDLNVAFKSGNKKLYNILLAGANLESGQRVFSFGFGIGREFSLSKKSSVNLELTEENILGGYKNDIPVLVRLQPSLQIMLTQRLGLFAGPAFSLYLPGSSYLPAGKNSFLPPKQAFSLWNQAQGWLGVQAGLTLF